MVSTKILKKQSIITNTIQIKLIKETQVFFLKHFMFIKGPRGIVLYSSLKACSKYSIVLEKNCLTIRRNFFNTEKNLKLIKSDNSQLLNLIKNLIAGVQFFFSQKLLLVGIGLKAWIKTLKNNQKVLLIKVGFSEDLCIKIPKSFLIFSL
jgi:ribosomal protein L6P/L9E